ncbi:MAG: putative transcriptional regulator [Bryobacterales bacterium]|nr:putative transcriptional regulator [Bryobacterales bacterium]
MELVDLQYLCVIAGCGGLSEAARLLGLNVSSLSRRISQLEDELGFSIFERSSSGVRLTEGGKDIVRQARKVQIEIETIKAIGHRNGTGAAGEVRLGIRIPLVGEPLRGLLIAWRFVHPAVNLVISELSDNDMAGAIISRNLDAVFVQSFSLWPHADEFPIYKEQFCVAVPEGHRFGSLSTVNWLSFVKETVLVQGWDDSHSQRGFFQDLLASGARFQIHKASQLSILGLVGAGFGVAIVPCNIGELTVPGVTFYPIAEANASFHVHLAWNRQADSPAIGRFIAFMRDESRARGFI